MIPRKYIYEDLRDMLGDVNEDEDIDDCHETRVRILMERANLLHIEKEKIYNRSFARRGLVGIFMNIARKFDNVETFVTKEEYRDFHLIDALFDIAIYSFKLIDVIRKIYPEVYDEWLKRVYDHFVDGNAI